MFSAAEVLRRDVFRLDQGLCVACGMQLPSRGGPWSWHVHHVIEKQTLRRRGYERLIYDPNGCVLVCRRCHERHTLAVKRIPGERLPLRCREFATSLGPWAEDLVDRYHPSGS